MSLTGADSEITGRLSGFSGVERLNRRAYRMYCFNVQLLVIHGIREYRGSSKPSWKSVISSVSSTKMQKIAPRTSQRIWLGDSHFEKGNNKLIGLKHLLILQSVFGLVFCQATEGDRQSEYQ